MYVTCSNIRTLQYGCPTSRSFTRTAWEGERLEMVTVAEVFEDGTEETLPACMELEG